MCQVWNSKGRFALLERLNVAVEFASIDGTTYYSGSACGIDTDKLAYFALSVLRRASVHKWKINGEDYQLSLGTYQEPIRQFLLGQMFPADVSVMLTVCSDMYSRLFYKPTPATFRIPVTAFAMLALGIQFLIITDRFSPPQICCVRSPEKRVYKRDCKQKTLEAYGKLIGIVP